MSFGKGKNGVNDRVFVTLEGCMVALKQPARLWKMVTQLIYLLA